jgi:pimeloyl-ACP methyl ester carboxylesterase
VRALLLTALVACSSPAARAPASKPLTSVEALHGTLHVDDGGTGDVPVLFIHGLAGDAGIWRETLAHVRAAHRAIAFDQHGFGASTAKTADFSVPAMATDVDAIVNATGAKRVVLVGHSYAGHVISAYAAQHPDRVAGLVYVDASGDESATPPADVAEAKQSINAHRDAAWAAMLQGSAPGVSDRVLATLHTTKPEPFAATFAGMLEFDPKAAMAAYHGPRLVLISSGQTDYANALHKVVPGIDAKLVAPASHWLFLDKPAEFYGLLDPFLAQAK